MSRRWGHKREISDHLRAQKTSGTAPDFLKKLEKVRSRTETEMAFMGILKVIQYQVFLRKLPGQSSRKVSELFRYDRGLCGFSPLGRAGRRAVAPTTEVTLSAQGKRVNELAIPCTMNEISFKSPSDPVRNC
jgi:hypothetical protein